MQSLSIDNWRPSTTTLSAHERMRQGIEDKTIGFPSLTQVAISREHLADCPSQLVVVGIGGSSKGAEMLRDALNPFSADIFVLDTFDRLWMTQAVHWVQKGAGVLIVSKSGGTLETIELADMLLAEGQPSWVGVVTDVGSKLDKKAKTYNWRRFHIPANVGGRYSVLSPVGYIPGHMMGIDMPSMFAGGQAIVDAEVRANGRALYIAERIYEQIKAGRLSVLVAYGNRWSGFCDWLTQLWWESLGQVTDDGDRVGPLLFTSIGPHAQHSIGQLLRDGPADKFVMTMGHETPEEIRNYQKCISAGHLTRISAGRLLHMQADATSEAVREAGQHTLSLPIVRDGAAGVGELIMTWQYVVSYLGFMLNINPYLQPGVERGKQLINQRLGAQA